MNEQQFATRDRRGIVQSFRVHDPFGDDAIAQQRVLRDGKRCPSGRGKEYFALDQAWRAMGTGEAGQPPRLPSVTRRVSRWPSRSNTIVTSSPGLCAYSASE